MGYEVFSGLHGGIEDFAMGNDVDPTELRETHRPSFPFAPPVHNKVLSQRLSASGV